MRILTLEQAGSRRANSDYFTGVVWQEPIAEATEPARVRGLRVSFEPGARTHWHTHPLGQTLYVLSGLGRIQKEGEPVHVLRPGDSVFIEPGERHWHGAAPGHAMCHIAVQEALDGKHVTWMEPVSETDYAIETSR